MGCDNHAMLLSSSPQMKHVEERFGPETNKEVLLLCIGITSCIGRFIFGRVADYIPGVNKVYLQVNIHPLLVLFHSHVQVLLVWSSQ